MFIAKTIPVFRACLILKGTETNTDYSLFLTLTYNLTHVHRHTHITWVLQQVSTPHNGSSSAH